MMALPQILIESCNVCQNKCENCAHQGMRDDDPTYQMGLDDIKVLIDHFLKLNCKIGNVAFHGSAEPLLWRHFNDAVRLIADSKLTDQDVVNGVRLRKPSDRCGIQSVTNGRLLHVIADDVWDKLTKLYVSIYGYSIDESILVKHPGKYEYLSKSSFDLIKPEMFPYHTFGVCGCAGPMYYKGMIYPYCGPPLFDACNRAKVDHKKYCIPLAQYNPSQPVKMPYQTFLPCAWCWANSAIPKYQVAQTYSKPEKKS